MLEERSKRVIATLAAISLSSVLFNVPRGLALTGSAYGYTFKPMDRPDKPSSFRFTEADREIISQLQKKLGLGATQVMRVALRKLHDIEFGRKRLSAG